MASTNNLTYENSWCALCERDTLRLLCLFKPLNSQFIEKVETKPDRHDGWLLTRCQECGLVSVDPLPSVEELHGIYNGDYYSDSIYYGGIGDWMMQKPKAGSEGWPWSRWNKQRLCKLEINHLQKLADQVAGLSGKPRLLDLGCGTGEVLAAARDLGWDGLGVEISREAVKLAQKESGMPVICAPFEELSLKTESFDIIHLREVLEHVRQPMVLLRRIRDWLRPGGVLYVQVPNDLAGYRSYLFKRVWWIFPPIHLHYFTPDVLSKSLADLQFTIVSSGSISNAIGIDCRRHLLGQWGLLGYADCLQGNISWKSFVYKLFQLAWDQVLFWPAIYILNRTMYGFTFWHVARKSIR